MITVCLLIRKTKLSESFDQAAIAACLVPFDPTKNLVQLDEIYNRNYNGSKLLFASLSKLAYYNRILE